MPQKLRLTLLATGVILAAGWTASWLLTRRASDPEVIYQAVYLDNGMVLYGRLDGLGTPFPVLHEVYSLKSGLNVGTARALNAVGKRSYEAHQPAYTVLNGRHIRLVEPVRPGSRIADSITELRGR